MSYATMSQTQTRGVTWRVVKRIKLPMDLICIISEYIGKLKVKVIPHIVALESPFRRHLEVEFIKSFTDEVAWFRNRLYPTVAHYHPNMVESDLNRFKQLQRLYYSFADIDKRQERRMHGYYINILQSVECLYDPDKCLNGMCIKCYESTLFDQ